MSARMRFPVWLVLLFSVVSVLLLWGLSLRWQAELREQVMSQSEQRSLQLAKAMAGQVEGVFSAADLALRELRGAWNEGNPTHFETMAHEALDALPPGLASHVTVVNAQGRVVYTSLGTETGQYVGDRFYFKQHELGGDRLVIGPTVQSRLDGRWYFTAGRPLARSGAFEGTLHLALSADYMSRSLAVLELSPKDVVALFHPDGTFMARSLDHAQAMGQRAAADRPFLLQPRALSGVFRQPGTMDQVPRTFGWQRLPASGVVLALGLADASVLGPLAPMQRQEQLLTAGLSLLLLMGGALIMRLLWRLAHSQAQAEMSEARLRDAQRLARVGHWELVHASGRLTWSDEVFELFGLRPGSLQPSQEGFMAMVHPEDRERVRSAFDSALHGQGAFNEAHRIVWPDGSVRHVRELCVTQYDAGHPVRSMGTVQDITEARSAQLGLQQLNEELEQRVEVRTRELEVLNRELEAFSYSVSHDLRTPLRSIHGFATLLQEDAARLTDEGRTHLKRIQESARRMGVLISDLLSMAHHSRAVIRHETVNLSDLAQQIAGELERSDPLRAVQWSIQEGLSALADPVLMRVVLQNLLGNAWKYSGRVERAQITFSRSAWAGGAQEFCVRDNGAGFNPAYADQLFQPFKRLHNSHEFEGSGVGLATVQRVVQRHGGQVRGVGAPGQGAAFFFSLPDGPVHTEPEAP